MSCESDDDDVGIMMFPITDLSESESDSNAHDGDDDTDNDNTDNENNNALAKIEEKPKAHMSLRQRRLSKALSSITIVTPKNFSRFHWLHAIKTAKSIDDPWSEFHIDELQTETVIRHRYSSLRQMWSQDEVEVKMETTSFNRGAMRQCYRLKKLSKFTHSQDWTHAGNYVAKHYIDTVDRQVYFDDVNLQMDAKIWGEEYNRHNPPKKVDIFQMYVLEFVNREGSPLYHLEHFIEGDYIKYNSNSGFVEDSLRHTPQSFSHFSFERSGHQLIIVDIQGVGDLYTDPQIHTANGTEYGDGNLGTKGMALFFYSHICNNICRILQLSEFDVGPNEINSRKSVLKKQASSPHTSVRGIEERVMSPSPREKIDISRILSHQLSTSSHESNVSSPGTDYEPMSFGSPISRFRMRCTSESDSATMTEEEDREAFARMTRVNSRPSCINLEVGRLSIANLLEDSILGKVHHEMAKYYELGRFTAEGDEIDWESALFHEDHAAQLGVVEAITTLAKLYMGMPHDVLSDCFVQQNDENTNAGVLYMARAAEAGDRGAMLYMAKAFTTGLGLGTNRSISWEDAFQWYDLAMHTVDNDVGGQFDSTMDDPPYQILGSQAELFLKGGHGLEKDPNRAGELYTEAADAAMAATKGRLANKYYALAEEAWAEVEEE